MQEDVLRQRVLRWSRSNGVSVRSFSFDGDIIEIELVGQVEPETTDLVVELLELADNDTEVNVFFIARLRLETTTTIEASEVEASSTTSSISTTTTLATTTEG